MQAVAYALLGILALLGLVVGYWAADRTPPVDVVRQSLVNEVVQPGGALKIEIAVHRRRACSLHVDRVILDHRRVRHNLEDLDYAQPPGPMGDDTYSIIVPIARDVSRGEARYRATWTFRCNPIHGWWPIVVKPQDVLFDVVGDCCVGEWRSPAYLSPLPPNSPQLRVDDSTRAGG